MTKSQEEFIELIEKDINVLNEYAVKYPGKSNYKLKKIINNFICRFAYCSDFIDGSHIDHNYELFKTRKLPYEKIADSLWNKTCIEVYEKNYEKNYESPESLNIKLNNKTNLLDWVGCESKSIDYKIFDSLFLLDLNDLAVKLMFYYMLNPEYLEIIKNIPPKIYDILIQNKELNLLFHYCLSYSFYYLRNEQMHLFGKRYLFTIEEANILSNLYQEVKLNFNNNPYTLFVTGNETPEENCILYINEKRSINTKEEFERRFKIATNGIFEGIDFSVYKGFISGSILIPCIHKSPLENLFIDSEINFNRENGENEENKKIEENNQFLNYLEYYYPSYLSLTDDEFNRLRDFKNIEESFEKEILIDIDNNTSEVINENENFVINNSVVKICTEEISDIDISLHVDDNEIYEKYVYEIYEKIKANCKSDDVYINKVKTINNFKFKIHGPGLIRPIDIFKTTKSIIQLVGSYHVCGVHSFYNGKDLTLFRSGLSCLLSGVSEKYSWFSVRKSIIDTFLKYASKGISSCLNKVELLCLEKALENEDRWSEYKKYISGKLNLVCKKEFVVFRPGVLNCGIRKGLRLFDCGINTNLLYKYDDVIEKIKKDGTEYNYKSKDKYFKPDYKKINNML